jgi:hypothetical protein
LKTKMWPLPPGTIALGFSGERAVAVRAKRTDQGYCITHAAEEQLPFSPFASSAPSEADCEILTQALGRLIAAVPQAYWPLQIALPDPAAIFRIMEFDSLPETPLERAAIAQFRLDREFPAVMPMQCSTQVISKEGEKDLLLALFIQRAWLDCLHVACGSVGFIPNVTDTTLNHVFNRFYENFKLTFGDGALILIESDAWSILFWDNECRPRFSRSRWRDKNKEKDVEFEMIIQDIERLIVSYVLHIPGRKIGGVYLCANKLEHADLVARLDKRMKIPCVQLDVTDGCFVPDELTKLNIPIGILAASVARK